MPLFQAQEDLHKSQRRSRRRRFLAALVAAVGAYFSYRWWRSLPQHLIQRVHRYLTPNRDFYTVSIGRYPDKPQPQEWELKLEGPGGSLKLGYEELRQRDARTVPRTLVCISNPVGGDAIGNAEWTVTPLAPLLNLIAGPPSPQLTVAFHALDGFDSRVPLAVALHPESYLAYQMNGVPLPREHGYPVRVLLPGKYGMKQPRWLDRIVVSEEPVSGYWERRGWSSTADVKITSRIDSASPTSDGSWQVNGVAYCGAEAVGRVQVRVDEESWREAEITSSALPNAWAAWQWTWTPVRPGSYVLQVRAFDAKGQPQIAEFSGSFPSGSTGLHRVIVDI